MSIQTQNGDVRHLTLRILFVFLLLQILPLDWKFYAYLFHINPFHLHYQDIFNLAHYSTRFSGGAASFTDWGILLAISIITAFIWRSPDIDYDRLLYWLRVLARYRLALAILAYGFIKFFPLQAPYPSLSNLNTPYGAFNRWKLFSMSLGVVPSYELFLGLVEIILGLLLLNRRTASIAAFIFLIFCGNVFMSNLAYEGGDVVYSFFLIILAGFIFSFDLIRIFRLIILQLPAEPNTYKPVYTERWRYVRMGLKSLFVLFFVVIYGVKTGIGSRKDPYQFPLKKGLPASRGLYNVSTFVINHDTLPYSPQNTERWKDVVFEEWNTISVRTNEPVLIDSSNEHKVPVAERDRNYESEGTNGRHYYAYAVDSVGGKLLLTNKNPHYPKDLLVLQYSRPQQDRVVLSGVNAANDSIYVVLDRLPKKYLLEEAAKGTGRLRKLKL